MLSTVLTTLGRRRSPSAAAALRALVVAGSAAHLQTLGAGDPV